MMKLVVCIGPIQNMASNKEIFGEHIIKNNLADYVIFGEGEVALDCLLKGNANYPGINCNNPVQIEDLTALPMPTYEYFDMPRYQNKKILITGSRGCVRKCTFCDIELTWPQFRYRRAEHIVAEMERHFDDYGITEFEFTDSLINGSMKMLNELCDLLIDYKTLYPHAQFKWQGQYLEFKL